MRPLTLAATTRVWWRRWRRLGIPICLAGLLGSTPLHAAPRSNRTLRDSLAALRAGQNVENFPVWESRVHYINDIWLTVQSDGWLGASRRSVLGDDNHDGSYGPKPREDLDRLGIGWTPSFEFPPRSQNDYLDYASLVIGCVRGVDTLLTGTWNS